MYVIEKQSQRKLQSSLRLQSSQLINILSALGLVTPVTFRIYRMNFSHENIKLYTI